MECDSRLSQRTSDRRQTLAASAERWGRYPVRATVEVVAHGGLLVGTATVDAAEVTVFPMTPPQPTALPPTELLDRLGTHLTRHIGRGVEYADIRTYVPGDQLRTVNWPVSARRGRLHVTQRLTDRSADVVVLIDGYPQPAGPATDATERIVRGAAQVVQTALRNGDRAGIVALGGRDPVGWAPTSGSASSTACSTPSSTPAMNSRAPQEHWRRGQRSRRLRSSSGSPRCSTPNSRWR